MATPGAAASAKSRKRDAVAAAADPGADRAEGDGAPDAEAALPDVERLDGSPPCPEVRLRGGDDVVEPAADDAERHRPGGDVERLLLAVPRGRRGAGR